MNGNIQISIHFNSIIELLPPSYFLVQIIWSISGDQKISQSDIHTNLFCNQGKPRHSNKK